MTTLTAPAPMPDVVVRRPPAAWRVLRWLTVVAWVVAVAVAVALGSRESSWDSLEEGLRSGRVTQVEVVGAMGGPDGLQHGEQGTASVDLRWREGSVRRYTTVHQEVGQVDDVQDPGTHVVQGRVDTALRSLAPGVDVAWGTYPGTSSEVLGWRVDGPWSWLLLVGFPLALVAVATGPEPRFATAWGWFWLVLGPLTLLAIPAYLFWGVRGRVPGRWRLTGPWAFALCLVAGPVVEELAGLLVRAV